MILLYFIIGIIYTIINGAVRKLNTDGDPLLTFVWVFLWPIGLLALLVYNTVKFVKKKFKKVNISNES